MRTGYRRASTDWRYAERIGRVLEVLWRHPNTLPSLERLAEIACFSPCHFHRIYRGVMGETIQATSQRMRLQRAARALSHSAKRLTQVAHEAGYGSAAAFVRIFGRHYGVSPQRYRSAYVLRLNLKQQENNMHNVEIRTQPTALRLLVCRHQGSYMEIGKAFDTLCVKGGLCAPESAPVRIFGLYYDDPLSVRVDQLRSAAGLWRADLPLPPDGLEPAEIPAGRYAVLRHRGPYNELQDAWNWLYATWLPQTGHAPKAVPCIEEYLNDAHGTAPKDLETDLWLALE